MASYAEWERTRSHDRRNRSRSTGDVLTAAGAPRNPSARLDEEEVHDQFEAPPPYNRGKPPKYSKAGGEPKPALQHTRSLPVTESHSVSQARFPTELPARGDPGPQATLSMGEVRRFDGRRPCRVGRDGKCECGKQVMDGESEEQRLARRREMFNMKGRGFWGMMGMSFARAFMI